MLCWSLLLLVWGSAVGTNRFDSGTVKLRVVVRTAEGVPVVGCRVQALQESRLTGEDGVAEFVVEAGAVLIRVSSEGFSELETTVNIEQASPIDIEVELTPILEVKEEIIVTATRTERRLEDQPVRVEVVDREEIEEKALMTPGSVAMLLAETTGLRVQTTAPSTGAANVRIQGLRGRYSQLLSDGLPLYGLQGDSLSLLQVPPLDLGQVEIIKGAASALYGPSALGGVIDLVSLRPSTRRQEVLLNLSTQEAFDGTFWMMEPPREKFAFTLLGGFHAQTRQDLDEDGWADLPTFTRGVLRPRFFWDDQQGRTLFATAGFMAENRRGGTMPDGVAPDGQPFPEFLDTRRMDGGTVFRMPAGQNVLFTLKGSVSYRSESRTFGESLERGSRLTWLAEGIFQGSAGRHLWVVGGAIQQDHYQNQDLQGFDFSYVTPGLIAQDDITLSDQVTLGVSGRLDHHSEYGAFFSPRVSLLYRPTEAWTVRMSGGTGFFAPTPFVEETEETGFSRLLPLSGLVAEKARSASIDAGWSKGPLEIVGTVFGSNVRDPVERRFVGEDQVELVTAQGPVKTWGTELLGRYRVEGFTLMVTHNYTSSTEANPEFEGRREVPLTPRHLASLNVIWEGESWGRFGIETYYVGRQSLEDNPYREEGRSYVLIGALLVKRFERFSLFVNFENLTNVRQTRWEPLVRPTRLPDGRWTVDAWAPLDGRVVNGGIRLTL